MLNRTDFGHLPAPSPRPNPRAETSGPSRPCRPTATA